MRKVLSLSETMRAIARLVAERLLMNFRMGQPRRMGVKSSRRQETLMLILPTMGNRVLPRTLRNKTGFSKT